MRTRICKILLPAFASAVPVLNLPVVQESNADGFVSVRSMNKGRSSHTATLLPNGKVLVAGTRVNGPDTTWTAELYDPATDRWTMTGRMRSWCGYNNHTATLLPNGKVLIAGGCSVVLPAELYDPATGTWTLTGSLKTGRLDHEATLLPDGKVLVTGGGADYGLQTDTAELYDPATGTWTATGPMTQARVYHTATLLLDGKVLVTGGAGGTSTELYDPATGMWTPTGPMTGGGDMATLLLNGKVLVAGGTSAELYDPDSGTWSATGSPTWMHYGGTATLVRNGQVFVAGGVQAGAIPVSSAELYDPATGTWTETPMSGGRYVHTATLLPNGKVLVAGGLDSRNINLSTAELYEPDSDGATPSITILHNANHILSFSWRGVGKLEQADSLIAPNWRPAPIQDNPHIVSTSNGPMKFFRVRFNQ